MSIVKRHLARLPTPTVQSTETGTAEDAQEHVRREPCNPQMRILRLPQVISSTGLCRSKIYEMQAEGDFPMRVKLTSRSVGWLESEVQAWLARRIRPKTLALDEPAVKD